MAEPRGFHDVMTALDYPMSVVTAAAGGEHSGCLVGFHTQCSIDPARYLVFISKANHTYPVAAAARYLAVHLLDESQGDLAHIFGEQTGDAVDKFTRCRWHAGPDGVPILTESRAWFVGTVRSTFDTGDHVGFLLDPGEGEATAPLRPLGFQQVRGLHPGHDA
jgi:flavin reductase (DIM6/NTAB) family NADH-FMN oxidoreductase RutF